MTKEVTVTVTVTHDLNSHYAPDDPTIKTIQLETKETSAPPGKFLKIKHF